VPQQPAQGPAGCPGGRQQLQLAFDPGAAPEAPAGQQQGNADAGVVEVQAQRVNGTTVFQKFPRGHLGFDRHQAGELLRAEDRDVPRRSWSEWQQWHPQLRTVAGISPAAALHRMGVEHIRRGKSPVQFSDLALMVVVAELGLDPLGLPGEAALRERLLAPQDPTQGS
jgi:hypothetical protein